MVNNYKLNEIKHFYLTFFYLQLFSMAKQSNNLKHYFTWLKICFEAFG